MKARPEQEIINNIMHDLRTPMTSIKGFAYLLKNQDVMRDFEKRDHYIDLLNKNINKLCGTINDLSVSGARPLYLTAGFIIEEGYEHLGTSKLDTNLWLITAVLGGCLDLLRV